MSRRRLLGLLPGLLLGAAATPALAHYPVCTCKMADAATVVCQGGFSDGASGAGVTLDVISYDEQILVSGKLEADSTFRFKRPEGDFYVLFDAGPGHTVEIEHSAIE